MAMLVITRGYMTRIIKTWDWTMKRVIFDYQNRDRTIRFDDPILRKLQLETTKMGMQASYT